MSDKQTDDQFAKTARDLLDESLRDIDGATLSKLTQARHAALEAANKRPQWQWALPALSSAAVVAVTVVVLLQTNEQSHTNPTTTFVANQTTVVEPTNPDMKQSSQPVLAQSNPDRDIRERLISEDNQAQRNGDQLNSDIALILADDEPSWLESDDLSEDPAFLDWLTEAEQLS